MELNVFNIIVINIIYYNREKERERRGIGTEANQTP